MVANVSILAKKQEIIDEVKAKVQEATTIVLFDYRGLTDNESKELRVKVAVPSELVFCFFKSP